MTVVQICGRCQIEKSSKHVSGWIWDEMSNFHVGEDETIILIVWRFVYKNDKAKYLIFAGRIPNSLDTAF